MVKQARKPCYILVGPEHNDRNREVELSLAPRLDYRLVAHHMNATIVECYPPPTALKGQKAIRLAHSLAGNFYTVLHLAQRIPAGSVVYSTGETWGVPMGLAATVLRKQHLSHVVYVHRVFSPSWLHLLRATRSMLSVDGWICVTSHQAQLLHRLLNPKRVPVAVISQGVDTDFFAPAKASPAMNRPPYILSVGVEMRNYDLLFDAVHDLDVPVVVKASSAWMIGGRSKLTRVPPGVRVISERLTYPELRNLYAGAALVVASLHETAQAAGITTILEAMAMDKCVVATRSSGLPDILIDGQTGVIVQPVAKALADAISELLAAPQRRATLANAAKQVVFASTSIDEHARRVAEFLASIHGGNPK